MQRSSPLAALNQAPSASRAASSRGRTRPTRIEGDSSTIAANVSATSSSTTRLCNSPERAVAAQSIRRTSSPGTYARSSGRTHSAVAAITIVGDPAPRWRGRRRARKSASRMVTGPGSRRSWRSMSTVGADAFRVARR